MAPVAVVDIGSNSTRLLIAALDGGLIRELVRRTKVTRLGAGVDASGRLRDDAIDRVLAVLDRYQDEIDAHGCERAVAVLTSAVRDACNGAELAALIADRHRLEAHVLSGDDEARMTFLGATDERDPEDPVPTLVVDVGGGSTELVIGTGTAVAFHASTQAGVVRQSERHLRLDPPSDMEIEELRQDVRTILEGAVPARVRASVGRGIGVAGTATSLAAIEQRLEPYDPERVHGHVVGAVSIDRILEKLVALDLDERRAVTGLHPDRAPTIVAGIVILRESMALFDLDRIEVSEHDILRGAIRSLISPRL
ncbi:MAG: Ppx/GppA phosphatase family protein [Solirubrobacteraceae bacterium]